METLKVKSNGSITLPRSIFKPLDKIAYIHEGDTLILKKLNSPKISEIAQKNKGKTPSLKEVTREIHLFRREKN